MTPIIAMSYELFKEFLLPSFLSPPDYWKEESTLTTSLFSSQSHFHPEKLDISLGFGFLTLSKYIIIEMLLSSFNFCDSRLLIILNHTASGVGWFPSSLLVPTQLYFSQDVKLSCQSNQCVVTTFSSEFSKNFSFGIGDSIKKQFKLEMRQLLHPWEAALSGAGHIRMPFWLEAAL